MDDLAGSQVAWRGRNLLPRALCSEEFTDLLTFHKHGTIPGDDPLLVNLLTVSGQLMLHEWMTTMLDIFSPKVLLDKPYPQQCSTEVMLQCFSILLESPLRTADIYKRQLERVAEHCSSDAGVMANAMNLVKEKLRGFMNANTGGIPVDFGGRIIPIVIYRCQGRLQTGIIDCNRLIPADVLGENFGSEIDCIESSCYLKYSSYILYKSGDCVYRRNFRDGSNAVEVFRGCLSMLTRAEFVFVLEETGVTHSVWKWVDDAKFVVLYRADSVIRIVDFRRSKRLLAIGFDDNSVRLFTLRNESLTLLQRKDFNELTSDKLPLRRMSMVSLRWCFVSYNRYGDFSLKTPVLSDITICSVVADDLKNMTFAGGKYFHSCDGALRLVTKPPRSFGTEVILAKGEHCALSDLWLSI